MMKSEKLIGAILLGIVAIFLLSALLTPRGYGMMGMLSGFGYGSMMLFGWLFGVLLLVALILIIVWLWKQIEKDEGKKR